MRESLLFSRRHARKVRMESLHSPAAVQRSMVRKRKGAWCGAKGAVRRESAGRRCMRGGTGGSVGGQGGLETKTRREAERGEGESKERHAGEASRETAAPRAAVERRYDAALGRSGGGGVRDAGAPAGRATGERSQGVTFVVQRKAAFVRRRGLKAARAGVWQPHSSSEVSCGRRSAARGGRAERLTRG